MKENIWKNLGEAETWRGLFFPPGRGPRRLVQEAEREHARAEVKKSN